MRVTRQADYLLVLALVEGNDVIVVADVAVGVDMVIMMRRGWFVMQMNVV